VSAVNGLSRKKGFMTDVAKKKSLATFEQTTDAMPRLAAEPLAPGAEKPAPEPKSEIHSIRVPKLDQQTVWRVIDVLKSL
jgi:hypothetical protein